MRGNKTANDDQIDYFKSSSFFKSNLDCFTGITSCAHFSGDSVKPSCLAVSWETLYLSNMHPCHPNSFVCTEIPIDKIQSLSIDNDPNDCVIGINFSFANTFYKFNLIRDTESLGIISRLRDDMRKTISIIKSAISTGDVVGVYDTSDLNNPRYLEIIPKRITKNAIQYKDIEKDKTFFNSIDTIEAVGPIEIKSAG